MPFLKEEPCSVGFSLERFNDFSMHKLDRLNKNVLKKKMLSNIK